MKPRSLIMLALVVAGLAAFITFYERDLPGSDERREQQDLVLDLDADDVTGVVIARRGEKVVELRRGNAAEELAPNGTQEVSPDAGAADLASTPWRLVRPFSFRAADAEVDGLVRALADLPHERVLESFDAGQLGLAKPRARVTLKRAGETVTLRIGKPIPAYSSIAVHVEGRQGAHIVGDALWDQVAKAPDDWRSRQVVPAGRDAIRRIAWQLDDTRFALARRDGELRIVTPYEDRADKTRVEELLTALTSLRVDRFLSPDAPADAGAERTLRLQVEGREEPFELTVTETGEGETLRLRYEGQVAATDSDLLDRLSGPPEAWRSRRWSSLDTWEVERATLRDADGSVTLARTDGAWTRDGEEIPMNAVTDLLDAVLQVEAEAVRPRDETWTPPAEPDIEIELQTEDDTSESLALYPDAVATTSTRQVLVDLPADAADRIHQRVADLRAAEPVERPEPSKPQRAPGGK